ncbi:unnamed protein product [Euphydryas editha]|uniref:Uncharacterized protein n=1 Tax=Euphydryas editha TaxID=104508 RepID=A0AAU9VAG6_EUPED|nr:unnamed protein product [Euphydryas editha]
MAVASVYKPDEDPPPPEELAKLVSHCESANLELLVATDCNGHHPLWGMQFSNEREGAKLISTSPWQQKECQTLYPTGMCRGKLPAQTTDGYASKLR